MRFSKSMFLDYLGHGLSVGELSLPLKYLKFLSQSSKQTKKTKSIKISKNWSETKFLNFDFTRIYKFCLEENEDKKLRNADWLFSYRRCDWWIWILSYHESALSVWTHRGTGIEINDQRKNLWRHKWWRNNQWRHTVLIWFPSEPAVEISKEHPNLLTGIWLQ